MDQQQQDVKSVPQGGGAAPGSSISSNQVYLIVVVLVFIGSIAGYIYLLHKPLQEEIDTLSARKDRLEADFYAKQAESKRLDDYAEWKQKAELKWEENVHYFLTDQFQIWDGVGDVIDMLEQHGLDVYELGIDWPWTFHPNQNPEDFDHHSSTWELMNRMGFGADIVVEDWEWEESDFDQASEPLFQEIVFSIKFICEYRDLLAFLRAVQDFDSDNQRLVSVHCFGWGDSSGGALRAGFVQAYLPLKMMLTLHMVNLQADLTRNHGTPSGLVGTLSCSSVSGGSGGSNLGVSF